MGCWEWMNYGNYCQRWSECRTKLQACFLLLLHTGLYVQMFSFFLGISLRKTTHFSELRHSSFFSPFFFLFLFFTQFLLFLFLPWFTFSFFGIFDAGSFLMSISSPSLLSNLWVCVVRHLNSFIPLLCALLWSQCWVVFVHIKPVVLFFICYLAIACSPKPWTFFGVFLFVFVCLFYVLLTLACSWKS